MNRKVKEWTHEQMNKGMNRNLKTRKNQWIHKGMNKEGQKNEWMNDE